MVKTRASSSKDSSTGCVYVDFRFLILIKSLSLSLFFFSIQGSRARTAHKVSIHGKSPSS